MKAEKTGATLLGLDIGTSGVKALLMDEQGRQLAEATSPLVVSRPAPGWSEQNPKDWWQASLQAMDRIAGNFPDQMARLAAIGLSGQMHGATLLDTREQVLRPAILWNDARAGSQCAELEAACPRSRDISGNIAMAGFTAPKLLWVRQNEPDIFSRIAHVLLPKDYVRFCLSGEMASDMSDAAGTLWLDVARRNWSDELLQATGLARHHMPSLFEGNAVTGQLKPELARRWNISGPVVIAGGGGDNAAAACGIGAVRPGAGFVSLGTSGVLFVSTDRFRPNISGAVHAFCHAVPDTWHQMGVILSATDSLNWIARLTGKDAVQLADAVGRSFREPAPEMFLPYLSGERTPHNDPDIRGLFAGLSHDSDSLSLTQAVMEGVAFAFRDSFDALRRAGTSIDSLVAVGGGSRSRLWLQMIATNLGVPIEVPAAGDYGAAFGAARLSLCALTGADPLQVCIRPPIMDIVEPIPSLVAPWSDKYARYTALYPAMKQVMT